MKPTAILTVLILSATAAYCHFQVLVPSTECVTSGSSRTVDLDIVFTHPMENGPVMNMAKPRRFGVLVRGETKDLSARLTPRTIGSNTAYACRYTVTKPGDHVFFIEPAPYWEPAEQKMIVHYTKVVVDGMGRGGGWQEMIGFPVEIKPLTRPYGLWTGNSFRGIVLKKNKPVPFAEIEIEYLNDRKEITPPADSFVTQVITADIHGVFSYTMPRAGWWGFAALIEADEQMANPAGKDVDVELGALMWVRTRDMSGT